MSEDVQACSGCGAVSGKRLRLAKCHVCEKSVCSGCRTQRTDGVICLQCDRPSDVGAENLLTAAKSILADIKAKQAAQSRTQTSERILNTSNGILEKYQSQVLAYDAEIQDMKKQIDWYAEQLDRREQTIEQMTAQMAVLVNSNQALDSRINALERLLGRTSLPEESKPEQCVRCCLF